MKRPLRLVFAVIAVQAVLIGVYWLIESRRSPSEDARSEISTAPPQRVDGSMPQLSVQRRDGSHIDLSAIERPTLLHFWATWCPPCRVELPGLLALPDEHSIEVVAIALDRDWTDVEQFLGMRAPSGIFLGDAARIETQLGVRSLPVTYLIEPGGRFRFRFDGARDWENSRFVRDWIRAAE